MRGRGGVERVQRNGRDLNARRDERKRRKQEELFVSRRNTFIYILIIYNLNEGLLSVVGAALLLEFNKPE